MMIIALSASSFGSGVIARKPIQLTKENDMGESQDRAYDDWEAREDARLDREQGYWLPCNCSMCEQARIETERKQEARKRAVRAKK